MQTPRDVIDNLMRKRPAERVGSHEGLWGDTVRKWVDQGMPANDEGKAVDSVDHFGYDMVGCGGWFDWQPIRGEREVVEETEEWKIVRNGSGALHKWWKNKSGTPEHVAFDMTSREVWERKYKPRLLEGDVAERTNPEKAAENLGKRHEQGLWTFFGSQFIWENMRASMGDECMFMSLLTDPDWIHDYNRTYTDLWQACYRVLFEQGGRPDGIWIYEDLGYRDRLFCSPKTYADLIFPYYAEMVEFFHGYDLPVVLHTCGFTEPALDMIVDAGFDALHPMEVKAGNDPLRIADNYAEKLTFIGGLDARILESGDRDLIRHKVTTLVEGMKARGAKYVYASDHSISTNVDYEDYCFAMEVYREHAAY